MAVYLLVLKFNLMNKREAKERATLPFRRIGQLRQWGIWIRGHGDELITGLDDLGGLFQH